MYEETCYVCDCELGDGNGYFECAVCYEAICFDCIIIGDESRIVCERCATDADYYAQAHRHNHEFVPSFAPGYERCCVVGCEVARRVETAA